MAPWSPSRAQRPRCGTLLLWDPGFGDPSASCRELSLGAEAGDLFDAWSWWGGSSVPVSSPAPSLCWLGFTHAKHSRGCRRGVLAPTTLAEAPALP